MKKTKILIITCILISVFLTACSPSKNNANLEIESQKSENDSNFVDVDIEGTNEVVLENGKINFTLDTLTTHFKVTDLRDGKIYNSSPVEISSEASSDDLVKMNSELTIKYYADQTTALYLYSGLDSVEKRAYKIKMNDETIRVYYSLGSANVFVPNVLTQNLFNEKILEKLPNDSLKRRIMRFYTLYDPESPATDFSEKAKQYPALKETPLYILDSTVSDLEIDELSEYIKEIKYSKDDYKKDLEAIKISFDEENDVAGFLIPIEYKLTDEGFSASILTDKIEEFSDQYILQSINFLEFFSAYNKGEKGSFLVPDGSGSVVEFDTNKVEMSKDYYGPDYSLLKDSVQQISKDLMFPVFGVSTNESSMLAIIETGAEYASLNVSPFSESSSMNKIYTTFKFRSMDVTQTETQPGTLVYNLFSQELISQNPKINFTFINQKNGNYAVLATKYREYLIKNQKLPEKTKMEEPPLYLDFLCMLTEDSSFLGVPYNKKTVVSSLDEIISFVEELNNEGVNNIVLRLLGYGSGGLKNNPYNTFSLDPKVGSYDELNQLADLLGKKGGTLLLDGDFQFSYTNKNGFNPSAHGAKYLNRTIVHTSQHDIITREFNNNLFRYYISPVLYSDYSQSFFNELKSSFRNFGNVGISYGSAGRYLGGDYSSKYNIDRGESANLVKSAVAEVFNKQTRIAVDNGFEYMLPYASYLFNVPLNSSESENEEYSVPFYQMVIHGSIPFSGTAGNISVNSDDSVLKNIEYGSVEYGVYITKDDSLIKNTSYESMYFSLSAKNRLKELAQNYKFAYNAKKANMNSAIVSHEKISKDLVKVRYDNGNTVYLNYSSNPQSIDGQTINANSYIVK